MGAGQAVWVVPRPARTQQCRAAPLIVDLGSIPTRPWGRRGWTCCSAPRRPATRVEGLLLLKNGTRGSVLTLPSAHGAWSAQLPPTRRSSDSAARSGISTIFAMQGRHPRRLSVPQRDLNALLRLVLVHGRPWRACWCRTPSAPVLGSVVALHWHTLPAA